MLTEATEESEQVVVEASHMHGVEISSMAMFRCEASYNIYFPSLPRICVGTPRNHIDGTSVIGRTGLTALKRQLSSRG